MFKKILAILIIFPLLFIIACGSPAETPLDHLSLGERFLLEMNYEQALVHFLALIDIEPMNPRGYTGAAEAHIGLGQVDEAIAVLRLGQERLPDNVEIRDMLDGLVPAAVERVTPLPEPEPESVECEEYEEAESEAQIAARLLAERLIELYQTSGYYAVVVEMRTDEFAEIVMSAMAELDYQTIIHITDDEFGGGFYLINGQVHVYIGGFDGVIRSGHGVWIRVNQDDDGYAVFTGEFARDMPNGFGELIHMADESTIEISQNGIAVIRSIRFGTFAGGFEHGQITFQHLAGIGFPCLHVWSYTAVDGHNQIIEVREDRSFVALCTECNSAWLLHNDRRFGVFGFVL